MKKVYISAAMVALILIPLYFSFGNTPTGLEIQRSNTSGIELGERQFVNSGGYSIRPIAGFQFQSDQNGTALVSLPQAGVSFLMQGGSLENGVIEEELSRFLLPISNAVPELQPLSDSRVIMYQNVPFGLLELGLPIEGQLVQTGQMYFGSPNSNQYFLFFAIAPGNIWAELGPELTDLLLSEIEFFPPE